MAREKTGLFQRWKDWTEKNRLWILYAAGVLVLLGAAAGWPLLPDQVMLQVPQEGQTPPPLVGKGTALGAASGLCALFAALFAIRPRELVYFVALWLAVFLVYSLLMINVVL